MSRGYGGFAILELEDGNCLIYSYGCYNLSIPEFRNPKRERDGLITIDKSCFLEPIITEKIKRQPGKRKKLIVKRHPVDVNYWRDIEEGRITIEHSKYEETGPYRSNYPITHILTFIFEGYQLTGEYPDGCAYDC